MQIDDLWQALEADKSPAGTEGGWVLRLARPAEACPLFVGFECSSRRRAILLRITSSLVPPRRQWPRVKALEATALIIEGEAYFTVALRDPRFADVFTALAEDLVRRVTGAGTADAQIQAFLGQLVRWQKFLSASMDGLTEEAQRGLWGELHMLHAQLMAFLAGSAVGGWKGGERAHQDFQFEAGAIEVKTTLAKQPQVVRITSERQLDAAAVGTLFLAVIAIDLQTGALNTLPALVNAIRSDLSTDAGARELFEDQLLKTGYLDAHAERYADHGYMVRSLKYFRVSVDFPRVTEADLPAGVGDINYGLSVSACERFLTAWDDVKTVFMDARDTGKGGTENAGA